MRIRFQLLLPFFVGLLMAAGFVVVAATVGDAVGDSLATVPGLTRERAVEAAVRQVVVGGVVVTVIALAASLIVARMIVGPLTEMQGATRESAAGAVEKRPAGSAVAEIRDAAFDVSRATEELRDRHRRAAREREELAALVEAVSEGIVQIEPGGRIVRANRASIRLLGLPEKVAGYVMGSVLRSDKLRGMVERAVAGEATDGAELIVNERRLLVSVSPQSDGGAVATFADLTDLRRLEEVRRDFVANASHELKTPLTSLRGYSETLLDGDLAEPERRQFLETIVRNTDRLQRIVDDLLDLSRLETGRWDPQLEPVDVLRIAEEAWGAFADRARARRIAFGVDGDPQTTVLADPGALEQVFANLYDNALRHTPEEGSIHVSVRRAPDALDPPVAPKDPAGPEPRSAHEPSEWVVVEVSDTGSGIPRDSLARIFERFYRVDPARSRAEGGTGLGLSIVRHMMESMSGAVRAESALGKGTTIRLWLREEVRSSRWSS